MPNKVMYRIDRFYNTTTLGVIQLKHISNRMTKRKKVRPMNAMLLI